MIVARCGMSSVARALARADSEEFLEPAHQALAFFCRDAPERDEQALLRHVGGKNQEVDSGRLLAFTLGPTPIALASAA